MQPANPNDRRRARERRGGADRRRNSDDRHVVIEVCDTTLRVAITVRASADKKPLLINRSLEWRDEASSPVSAFDCAELTAAFKTLASEERLGGAETVVLLGARLCVTRTAIGGGAETDRKVKELEERGQLYLALGGGEVCVAKSTHAVDARHRHALVSMSSQRVVDAVADAAHSAGLNLRRVESSLVSLCRAHQMLHPTDESPALLVAAQEEGLAIGVSHNGRLLLEYLPGGSPTAEQAHEVVRQHLDRFRRVCQQSHVDARQELTNIYVSGSPAACRAATRRLRQIEGMNVRPLVHAPESYWELRDQAPDESYAAALGASLMRLAPDRLEAGPNLLENWIRESRKHLRPILIRSAAPVAAVLLIAAVMLGLNASVGMSNSRLAARVAEAEPIKIKYRDLRMSLAAADAKLRSLRTLAQGLPATPLDEVVQRVGQCLPADVWLERLAVTDQSATAISGSGFTESGVFEFVGHIESMPGAANAALQETGVRPGPQGPVNSFSMTVDFELGAPAAPQEHADE